MNRRSFIGQTAKAGSFSLLLSGLPVKLLALDNQTHNTLLKSQTDRVLILLQMHGGNDGLNTIIPINQYSEYYNLRPNVAIPDYGSRKYITLSSALQDAQQIGLHPDMTGFKFLYDEGRAMVVQNVGYENMNLSHFRGRDIMFMGGGSGDYYNSGWMGRFLNSEYPGYPENYPNDTMKDPLALEIGNSFSLAFHRENGIPVGFNVQSPQKFYDLITGVGVNPPITFPDSHAGDELRYLMEFEKQSNVYAERLRDAYNAGTNYASVTYPETYPLNADARFVNNPLSGQLKLIARLLSGGLKTRIFLCRIGGFDTHAEQVEKFNTSMGGHAALLYHLSSAMKAFQDDLKGLGLEEKVISMTFTEFGRRAYSNASYGTDHGTSFPVLLFGKALEGGVAGNNPNLSDLDNGNLKYELDYRQIYTTLLVNWFGVSSQTLTDIYFNDWIDKRLKLIDEKYDVWDRPIKDIIINEIYPNPVKERAVINCKLQKPGFADILIIDNLGRTVKEVQVASQPNGIIEAELQLGEITPGVYHCVVRSGNDRASKKFVKAP
jgi:uncharacterized protein (DUF1501 family)